MFAVIGNVAACGKDNRSEEERPRGIMATPPMRIAGSKWSLTVAGNTVGQ